MKENKMGGASDTHGDSTEMDRRFWKTWRKERAL